MKLRILLPLILLLVMPIIAHANDDCSYADQQKLNYYFTDWASHIDEVMNAMTMHQLWEVRTKSQDCFELAVARYNASNNPKEYLPAVEDMIHDHYIFASTAIRLSKHYADGDQQ
jgi:hypothetical protein